MVAAAGSPAVLDTDVAAIGPSEFGKALLERGETRLPLFFACGTRHQHANAPQRPALLRPCCKRPRRRASEPRDELPSPHWITSSAVARSVSGMVRPSLLAVLRFRIVTYLTGVCTGRSAGFAPRRIRST